MLRADPASDESCQGRGHAEKTIAVKDPSPSSARRLRRAGQPPQTVAKTDQLAQPYDPGHPSPLIRRMYHRRTPPATEIEQNFMVTCMIITKHI
jgi:hypothetical protein